MPIAQLPVDVIGRVLAGGNAVCADAGIPIAGGHTIDSVEPIYGLVVMGLVHPDRVRRNADARAGDVLVLGKPLGVGVLSAALKKGRLDAAGYARLIATTTRLNKPGAALAELRRRARASPTSPASAWPATRWRWRAAPACARSSTGRRCR